MRYVLLLLVAIIAPSLASAEGLKYIPMWGEDGELFCYTLEEAKELILIDKRLDILIQNEVTLKDQLKTLEEADEVSREEIKSLEAELVVHEEEAAALTEQLEAKIKESNEWRRKAETKSPVPWVIAGTSLAIAGGLAIAVAILANKADNVPSAGSNGMSGKLNPTYTVGPYIEFHF